MIRKSHLLVLISISLVALFSGFVGITSRAAALSGSSWQAGNIIDDHLFFDGDAMSVSEIQAFLNTLVPSCDTWGKKMYNSTQTRAQFGTSQGTPPPYICVKNYYENPTTHATNFNSKATIPSGAQSAAQIIYNAARDFNINPRVLLVTIKKEAADNLIEDDWPWLRQYRSALGFGCPDTAACDSQYYGFYNQVRNAAKQFRLYADYPDSYRRKAGETYAIQYHPFNSCASPNVRMENQATAGLYNYTPYQPNAAALNNLYGTGDNCSSYGNRNFWRVWNDWFGSTHYVLRGAIGNKYYSMGGKESPLRLPTSNESCNLPQGGCYQTFEGGAIYWTSQTGAHPVWGGIRSRWSQLSYERGPLGYPTSDEIATSTGGVYQQFQGGRIYWKSGVGAWSARGGIGQKYVQLGADTSYLGYPTSDEVCGLKDGGCRQVFQGGLIVWSAQYGPWGITQQPIGQYWLNAGSEQGFLGYPKSDEMIAGTITYQIFQNGKVYRQSNGQIIDVRGAIGARYSAIGAETNKIGYPVSNEICNLSNGGCLQEYQNGVIIWSSRSGAWELENSIKEYWTNIGGVDGYIGYPISSKKDTDTGSYQQFQGGRIYWKSDTEIFNIHGGIGNRYLSLNGETGPLGYPTSDEIATSTGGVYQQFQGGRIYWKSGVGAWSARGGIGQKYVQLGADTSYLGYPTSDEVCGLKDGGCRQVFQGGRIYWKSGVGAWSVHGAINSKYLASGAETSYLGYPTSSEVPTGIGSVYQQFQGGRIYWTVVAGARVEH